MDAVGGQAALRGPVAEGRDDGAIRVYRLAAAAQDGGVAGLGAEDGGVTGNVGARLVDDAHDADGHAPLGDLDPVGTGPRAQGFTHRVRQVRDGTDAVRHGGEALGVEPQAVEQRAGETVRPGGVHIRGVPGKDGGLLPRRRQNV